MAYEQVIADHRLLQVSLERFIASLAQTSIAKVVFQTLYHPLNRGTAGHDGLEAFGHGRVVRIDMRQGLEGNRDGASRLRGTVTAIDALTTAQTYGCPFVASRRFIDEFAAVESNAFIVQFMTGQANGLLQPRISVSPPLRAGSGSQTALVVEFE